ncbi:unnamed protein product [Rhizoctonia solani]|uniref:MRP-L27 domain-containing protein n=2 Tax=Rhizoctonia solani TaxID=456999 RepID=A0A8H2Y4X1_9AGAM|nr:unnamed protein product [Rhizoctonia solani]
MSRDNDKFNFDSHTMIPTRAVFSKASRLPLTPKHGNKDFYKGTRAAYLPGGHRTGAPGKHVIGGKAKFRVVDEMARYFVAPPIQDIINSLLKPYVRTGTKLSLTEQEEAYGKLPQGRFGGLEYLRLSKALHDAK